MVREAIDERAKLALQTELLRNLGLYTKEAPPDIAHRGIITFRQHAYAAINFQRRSRSEEERAINIPNAFGKTMDQEQHMN